MSNSEKLIYVVDDEQNIRDLLKTYLTNQGFEVKAFEGGEPALEAFREEPCDMMVIDIMMPGMDGYSLCRELRKISNIPVIMVSAKDDEIDKILGLEIGGDDYLAKPFSPRELVARIRSVFRRFTENEEAKKNIKQIEVSDVIIYLDERKVLKGNSEVEFTSKEYNLLVYLAENKNKVFKREQLITSIWGYDFIGDTRAVDDLVKRIRKKLLDVGSRLEIKTVWGYGYKIVD